MSNGDSQRYEPSGGPKPEVYDPTLSPGLFEGVLARRVIAFIIDVIVITIPVILLAIFIAVFGVLTLGLGWILFWILSPAAILWALLYYGMTLGGPYSATLGMRVMGIEMRTLYGAPAYFVLGAVHAILFWISVSTLTPFILLVGLFNERRRLLHDFLLGAIIVNSRPDGAAGVPATGR